MKTSYIVNEINNHFTQVYKGASRFSEESRDLWDFCIKTISNPVMISEIVFANDLGIPPVRSLLKIWEHEQNPDKDFKFSNQESQWLGALMGFVFKSVLGYKNQKERCRVNEYGVKTATRFLDGNYIEFEK